MSFIRSRPLKYSLITIAVLVVLCGLLLGAFQLAVTRVPEYRSELQTWLGEKTGLVIEFKGISARLRLYGPELVFRDAIVRTPDRTRVLATARRGSVGFDLWTSLTQRHLTAGRFTLDSPAIGLIRTRQGRIQIAGQSALPEHEARPISVDALPVGEFRVRNAVVSFRDEVTGRGPWSLSGVSFILGRQSELLELHGDASLPRALGQSLEFSARVAGALDDVDALQSVFNVEGRGLDLAGWADVMPNQWVAPETGHGSIELSVSFIGTQPDALTADIDLAKVSAAAPEWIMPLPGPAPLVPKHDEEEDQALPEPLAATVEEPVPAAQPQRVAAALVAFERFTLHLQAQRTDRQWHGAVTKLDLSQKDSPWQAAKIDFSWLNGADGSLRVAADADRIVLQNLWPLLAYLPESEALARVRALDARGIVDGLSLELARASGQPASFTVKADVRDAGIRPVLNAPGISGISAHIEGTNERGTVRVQSADVGFELPHMFRTPLGAESVEATLGWEHLPDAWRIEAQDLNLTTQDGSAQLTATLTLPFDGSSPLLDLTGVAHDLRAAATPKYLPANKLTSRTLAWFGAAFPEGRVDDAEVRLHGPVRSFPFRGGEGEFVARGHAHDLTFNYHQGWAPAEAVDAMVEFRNEGMRATRVTAVVGGLHVTQASCDFGDFKKGDLRIRAQAAGDLGDALELLQTSPLRVALGEQFQLLEGSGSTVADVDLRLPLKHLDQRRVEVTTTLKDATVTAGDLDAPVTALSGSLIVVNALPERASLTGEWLGGPLQVNVEPVESAAPAARLVAIGHASAASLMSVLHLPASVKLTGATQWQLTTPLETVPEGMSTPHLPRKFVIESDLVGLEIGLPYPVGKSASEHRASRFEIEYDGDSTLLGRAALGNIRALMRVRQQSQGWSFDRGSVRADGVAAALPAHPGIGIEGELDHFNLDDWLALRGNGSGNVQVSDVLKAVNVHVGTFEVFGYRFADVRGVLRAAPSAWKVSVAGPDAAGALTIPTSFTGTAALVMKMDRLVIDPPEGQQGETTSHSDPRNFPNMQIDIQDLRYDEHPVGVTTLQASRVPFGLRIDSLTVLQSAMHGEAHGEWIVTPDGERSSFNVLLASTDVAASLRALKYPAFMEAQRGQITADLSWPGGIDRDFPARASGTIAVVAENGQLVTLQPGAGRVLGLFSVAALPRRLALDFSDLTDKGLSFDAIHGDFELRDGNAYTNNVLLRGPAAEIGIAGRVGLGAHDYDQTAVVTGNLGASLPVAGVLAGGPAVGAALLLFSQVFKEPLKGITRGYYRITGPCDNQVVERIDAAQAKDAAAGAKEGA
jgi:uncharacterized protein (TIGR02099 family)